MLGSCRIFRRSFHATNKPQGPRQKLQAIVCDLGGTTVDKYGLSVLSAYQRAFQQHSNIFVPKQIIRERMGTKKDLHIRAILQHPEVGTEHTVCESRVKEIYDLYTKFQLEFVPDFCHPVPGAVDALENMRTKFNVKIFATTGFPRQITDAVLNTCRPMGLWFDDVVASDDLPGDRGARQFPYMMYRLLTNHEIHPRESVLKLDDTVVGIEEGHAAGTWTGAVCRYSNGMIVDSLNHEAELNDNQITEQVDALKRYFDHTVAPDYTMSTFQELEYVCADIDRRLLRHEHPSRR